MKTETVAEFLARGGNITRVTAVEPIVKVSNMRPTSVGPAVIVSMEEADLYHGERKVRKAHKKKETGGIDIHALPEALRKKYIDEVISGQEDDIEEENS